MNQSKLLYCKNPECDVKDCIYDIGRLDPRTYGRCVVGHLEGNPLYCKKPDWNGNQFKEKKDETN